MAKFTEDVIAGKIEAKGDQDDVRTAPFQVPSPEPAPIRRPWLMAASIAGLLIAGGAGTYIAKTRLDEAASRQLALEQEIDQLTAERDDRRFRIGELDRQVAGLLDDLSATEEAKTNAEGQITNLQSQQANLEQQVAGLQNEIVASTDRARHLDQRRVALASEVDRLRSDITETELRLAETATSLSERDERIAVLEKDLEQQRIDLAETLTSHDRT
jgi:chromosome segregation ATPase